MSIAIINSRSLSFGGHHHDHDDNIFSETEVSLNLVRCQEKVCLAVTLPNFTRSNGATLIQPHPLY